MSSLKEYTTEELQREIEHRQAAKTIPTPLEEKDFNTLISLCVKHIVDLSQNGYYADRSIHHCIYEEALKCVFGQDIFDWINQVTY